MGFKSNINYGAYEQLRARGDEGLTRAKWQKKKEDEAEARRLAAEAKAAANRRSGPRSGLQKLGSAALRGAAAYYTGGGSEAFGGGDIIDEIILGRDDQGRPVRNEYGELVRAGSGIYGAMKAKKAGDVARKRGSNIQDYEEQVRLATEMGKLDKVLGKEMLQDAQSYRARQQAQTQAAEDASIWGWDNEFDDLELSPAQRAGVIEADDRILGDKIRRHGRKDVGMIPEDYVDMIAPTVRDDEGKLIGDKNRIIDRQEEVSGRRRDLSGRGDDYEHIGERTSFKTRQDPETNLSDLTSFGTLGDRLGTRRNVSEMADKIAMRDMIDREMDERSVEKRLDYDPALEKTTTGLKGTAINPYKTYSEKEAEKLSKKDDYRSSIDRMSDRKNLFDTVKKLEKQPWYERIGRSDAEKQMLLEAKLIRAEELAEEHARTGGPYGGEWLNRLPRHESALVKRIKAENRAKGSILHR